MKTALARRFLDATADLPHVTTRVAFRDSSGAHYYDEARAAALPDSTRTRLVRRELDEGFYYFTRYGSPLAYARPLELLSLAGFRDVSGRKLLDFGYGTIGQLRLLASLGAEAIGVEVDPMHPVLYGQPGDQGVIHGRHGRDGRVRLVNGRYPSTDAIVAEVGDGYDLFISKNTLKNGYLHPERPVDKRMLVDLGVGEREYMRNLYRILKPGRLAMIYNLSPAPSPPDKPYKPWADGRCPFPRAMWESAGFEVLEFDRDDGPAARAMGHALRWDQGDSPMDLRNDLFSHYTLVRRPR